MIYRDYMAFNVTIPQVEQKVFLRRNIADIIESATLDELIYLIAPYGSGKTMAVISWLREGERKAAWVNLGGKENTRELFLAYLSAALMVYAGESEAAESIHSNPHFAENPRMFLADTLIRISPAISERILVIDNFQCIHNDGLLREIKEIALNMLGCWRVIFISRSELPPVFSDFMLQKKLRLITLNDLNFSFEETGEYFSLNGLTVDRRAILQVREDTDGWPAALNTVLTVPHNEAVKYTEVARAYVMGYFESEIWAGLGKKTREFLLKTSILDELTPSICYFVTKMKDTHNILKNLYTNGIFLFKRDRDTYCYHRAFREFLTDKLSKSGIDANSLYIDAGWWLYEKNKSIPALLCFYHAKYLHGINMAFKKVKPAYMGMDEYIDATLCLTTLDIMELKAHPEVAARIALLHFLTNNIAETQRIYRVIRDWLEPGVLSISPEEYTDFYWEVGWLRYVDPDEDILFNSDFDNWVNVHEYAPHLLENDRARASTLRLPSIMSGVRDFSVDVDRALSFYAANNADRHSIRYSAGLLVTDIIFAEICYERENFEQAEEIIKRIMPVIVSEKYTEFYFSCIVLLVKIVRAIHDSKEVEKLTARLKTQIHDNGHLFLLPNFHAFELRNHLADGMSEVIEEFEKKYKPHKDRPYYYMIYRNITYVRALISEKRYNEAAITLGNCF